jgi:hypothetical protein
MGTRYLLEIICPKCGLLDSDVYFAPTCGFTDWECDKCGTKIDLCEHTGISYEDASNAGAIKSICEKPILLWPDGEEFDYTP